MATWLGGCLSVCHSQYCIKTTKPILKRFWPSGSPILEAFGTFAPRPNSKGTPSLGAINTRGWEKLAIFDRYICLCGKRCEIGRWLLWNFIGSHGCRIEWYNFQWPWMTLTRVSRSRDTYKSNTSRVFNCTKHSCRSLGALPKNLQKKLGVVVENFAQEGRKFLSSYDRPLRFRRRCCYARQTRQKTLAKSVERLL